MQYSEPRSGTGSSFSKTFKSLVKKLSLNNENPEDCIRAKSLVNKEIIIEYPELWAIFDFNIKVQIIDLPGIDDT